jgi:branched-chain amino acid transport system permease protein
MLINALNGLVYGSLLFVLSAGLVLFYGLRRVVNFANGALRLLGAYIGYSAAIRFGIFSGVVAAGLGLGWLASRSTSACSGSSALAIRS